MQVVSNCNHIYGSLSENLIGGSGDLRMFWTVGTSNVGQELTSNARTIRR